MMNRSTTLLGASALAVSLLATGCRTPSSDTLLLKKDPGSSVIYRAPGENDIPYAANVVHVPRDARFSLSFEAINPGWLHQKNARRRASDSSGLPFFQPASDLAGKDLWLLIHVRTLSPDDPWRIESKRISRASLVKYDVRSFGLIPLTVEEVTPFALEANNDYEIEIRLYEVTQAFRDSPFNRRPGLSGVARTAWTTTTDTFKALVGDSAVHAFDDSIGALPVERQLLDAGAALQFNAKFAVYRSSDTLAPRHADDDPRGDVLINRYQIIDPYNRRDTNHRAPRAEARYADTTGYLEQLNNLENAEVPGRQDAYLRFRIESMWSPVAQSLAQIESTPKTDDDVTQEQVLAAEALATIARETFLKVAEEEKQANLAAAEALRKSGANAAPEHLEETARTLSRKTQEVAAARAAMETAQARARQARQSLEAAASRIAETANAEKTVALANTALDKARRATDAAVKELDDARAALVQTRDAAEAARLKKEQWMDAEARAHRRLNEARAQLAALTRKAEKKPDDAVLRVKVVEAEEEVAAAARAVETAISEWKLAQKDQEAKLNEVEDHIDAVAQLRLALAEAEQEKQRARVAKDRADAILNGTDATDPRPSILRAQGL